MTRNVRRLIFWNPAQMQADFLQGLVGAGWDIHSAASESEVLALLEKRLGRVGLIVLDRLDEVLSAQIRMILRKSAGTEWVAVLAPGCLEAGDFHDAALASLFDYHTYPVDQERLLVTLGHAHGMARLRAGTAPEPELFASLQYKMVGDSAQMQAVFTRIGRISAVDAPVLLTGESGTGKELAALAIHNASRRARKPFIAVNCAAIPHQLMQSELFGHEKGAFTGAHQRKIGRVAAAAGGTIFLDEIGDLPLELQVNLLRFLQENHVDPVGGSGSVPVDVRVLAATHRDLEKAVREGAFREDLFYRLNVLQLYLPALRERPGDIRLLAQYAFDRYSAEKRPGVTGFSKRALRAMDQHRWPGNVRELVNRVRRAMVMCETRLILPEDLGLDQVLAERAGATTLVEARAQAERKAIEVSLATAENNVSQAARLLGVSRGTLYRLMDKHGLLECKEPAVAS